MCRKPPGMRPRPSRATFGHPGAIVELDAAAFADAAGRSTLCWPDNAGRGTLTPFLLSAFLRGRNVDAKSKIGVCSGVGGPVGGVPLVGDGGSLGEVGGGLVVTAEEES